MDPVRSKNSGNSADSPHENRTSNGVNSLQDILGTKKFVQPDEMKSIKEYVRRRYKSPCKVKSQRGALIVSVSSSGLAATIYLERQALIDSCNLSQRLVIRTG